MYIAELLLALLSPDVDVEVLPSRESSSRACQRAKQVDTPGRKLNCFSFFPHFASGVATSWGLPFT